jgi:hypothetical protein
VHVIFYSRIQFRSAPHLTLCCLSAAGAALACHSALTGLDLSCTSNLNPPFLIFHREKLETLRTAEAQARKAAAEGERVGRPRVAGITSGFCIEDLSRRGILALGKLDEEAAVEFA